MAFIHQFIIDKKRFDRRILTELQHRIRVPLKCYTLTNFKLNPDNTFSFKKTVKKFIGGNKMVIPDPIEHHGSYQKEEFNTESYRITLTFYD